MVQSAKFIAVLALSMTGMVASRAAAAPNEDLVAKDVCNGAVNRCDDNGCGGVYSNPNAVYGTCTTGKYAGCPCAKCGKKNGSCADNGCFGQNGKCTQGPFQGCPCN